jgi:hypothetical protein
VSEPEHREPVDAEHLLEAVDDVADPQEGPARGMKVLSSDTFSASDAVGGVRGVIESVAPGMLFVVVYIATGQQLTPSLVVALGAAVITVVARLVQRQPPTQAFGGFLGVAVGVLWAWRTGDAKDFFAYGLWINVSWFLGTLLTIVIGWPLVGLVVGMFSKTVSSLAETHARGTSRSRCSSFAASWSSMTDCRMHQVISGATKTLPYIAWRCSQLTNV